ncbi:hypothetical protein ABD91_25800 [Lysinibacillus sphaericus]|uniref:ATPase n=1 Tax=Lysinibacillus sphaericus TaxID=1421 RepID=UPI0018CF7BD3|nr:ATPase [Lysinibacillus sphaericus]MBG9694152.1 hypothetical protein [Lysinibacillus sphaericus]
MNSNKNRLLLATGQEEIDVVVKRKFPYEFVGEVYYKEDAENSIRELQPDIVIIGEALSGSEAMIPYLMRVIRQNPKVRIIYLAGYVDMRDEVKIHSLGLLVMAGLYDIVHEKNLTIGMLEHLLENPKTEEQMGYLLEKTTATFARKNTQLIDFETPADEENEGSNGYKNLTVISSIKPGTGKSFVSTNVAEAIAEFGKTIDGRKPRVALIEGDLQNLSVGTLLSIEDDKRNLKTAIDKISSILNEKGELIGGLQDTEDVKDHIMKCFKPYHKTKNLECLVGSQLLFGQLEDVKPHHYVYLIEAIIDEFDVVIVDTNSSLTHVTTFPLLAMAKSAYYILNLDYNNVRNNNRYAETLKEIKVLSKVRYILNEDIPQGDPEYVSSSMEELIFTADLLEDAGFTVEARIPQIEKTVFLNRIYNGEPIVLDNNKYTLKARYELLKIANQIYPIANFDAIEREINEVHKRTPKKTGRFLNRGGN